jgi:hypothetical protein
MIAVRDGFNLGIDPKLLSHLCKLMIHNENISNIETSSINIIELYKRIKDFDKKYN